MFSIEPSSGCIAISWLALMIITPGNTVARGYLRPCATHGKLGWISDGQNCYYISPMSPATQLAKGCFGTMTNLTSIHSDCESRFLSDAISTLAVLDEKFVQISYLIGLQDAGTGTALSERVFLWDDGTKFDYQNWKSGEPNNFERHEPCTELYPSGKWNDNTCSVIIGHICKIKDDYTAKAKVKSCRTTGKEEWISQGSSCYLISNDERSFDDARTSCRSLDADLLSVHGKDESQLVLMAANNNGHVQDHWIGLDSNSLRFSQWTDGTSVDYQNWFINQPSSDKRECVLMFPSGIWSIARCEDTKGFICKQENAPIVTGPGISFELARYDRRHRYGNANYTFSNLYGPGVNFKGAQIACGKLGAELLSIHSQEEVEFILNVTLLTKVREPQMFSSWIGLVQLGNGSSSWLNPNIRDIIFATGGAVIGLLVISWILYAILKCKRNKVNKSNCSGHSSEPTGLSTQKGALRHSTHSAMGYTDVIHDEYSFIGRQLPSLPGHSTEVPAKQGYAVLLTNPTARTPGGERDNQNEYAAIRHDEYYTHVE